MSAAPPPYTPQSVFGTLAQRPIVTAGLPGAELDQEFVGVQTTLNGLRDRLSEIQRDDGKITNGIVGFDALAPEILQFAVQTRVNQRGPWTADTAYVFDGTTADVYSRAGVTYMVAVSYTSGSTFGSLDTSKTSVIGSPASVGTIVRTTFTGNGSTTAFTMTEDPITSTNVHVYVNGLLKLYGTDFTLAGAVINFAVAPANAAVIVAETGVVSEITVTTVQDGAITAPKIATAAVTSAKIAAGAVVTAALADAGVTQAKLAAAAVNASKIEAGAVTTDKIAASAVANDKLADGSVTDAKIASGAVTTGRIATGAVSTGSLADSAVSTLKIADNAVTTAKILDAATTTAKIADANVTTAKVADAGITAPKLSGAQTGSAPVYGVRAWATFDATTAADKTGTYSQTGTTVTVTVTAHGLRVGQGFYADFSTGAATDGDYVVATVIDANNFTFTRTTATTSGNVTLKFVTITASGNVASIYRMAAGDFGVNFTTAMPSADYSIFGSGIYSTSGNALVVSTRSTAYTSAAYRKTVDTIIIFIANPATGSGIDGKENSIMFLA